MRNLSCALAFSLVIAACGVADPDPGVFARWIEKDSPDAETFSGPPLVVHSDRPIGRRAGIIDVWGEFSLSLNKKGTYRLYTQLLEQNPGGKFIKSPGAVPVRRSGTWSVSGDSIRLSAGGETGRIVRRGGGDVLEISLETDTQTLEAGVLPTKGFVLRFLPMHRPGP